MDDVMALVARCTSIGILRNAQKKVIAQIGHKEWNRLAPEEQSKLVHANLSPTPVQGCIDEAKYKSQGFTMMEAARIK